VAAVQTPLVVMAVLEAQVIQHGLTLLLQALVVDMRAAAAAAEDMVLAVRQRTGVAMDKAALMAMDLRQLQIQAAVAVAVL
jgi:hypothetical protein